MTNFEKTVTLDFFAETLGNLLESYLCDCADCPFNDFCKSLPAKMVCGSPCADVIKKWAKAEASVLDEVEKEYLKNLLAPWLKRKDTPITVEKVCYNNKEKFLAIAIKDEDIDLPFFYSEKMYKGMKANKIYTVEELGLR